MQRCKPGFFNLDGNLTVGCLPCFCFGHSSECKSSTNHFEVNLESSVNLKNLNEWTASDAEGRSVYVGSDESDSNGIFVFSQEKDVWFNAPG
jgi:laminin gamma 1